MRKVLFLLGLALIAVAATAGAQPQFRAVALTDDGTPIFNAGIMKINEVNQVLISGAQINGEQVYGVVWQSGSTHHMTNGISVRVIEGMGINDAGIVCGKAELPLNHFHAVATDANGVIATDLGILSGGHVIGTLGLICKQSWANDINNSGACAGVSNDGIYFKAALFAGGGVTDLGSHPLLQPGTGASYGKAINLNSQIVGEANGIPNGGFGSTRRAFYWDGSMTAITDMWSGANDLNNVGGVCGYADFPIDTNTLKEHAFYWSTSGSIIDIHGVEEPSDAKSEALGINDSGWVVGAFKAGNNAPYKPLFYYNDSTYDLNDLIVNAPELTTADDINNAGYIVGRAGTTPYLLVPVIEGCFVVNSTGDDPDHDLTDGECSTGNTTGTGEPECTFRAAIQQANFDPGVDTICFNIPSAETPIIPLGSFLPAITDPVVIRGETQPAGGEVIVDGSALGDGSGLALSSDNSLVRSMVLRHFTGNGISITGNGNTLEDCAVDSTVGATAKNANATNGGHGIVINGDGNWVGGDTEGTGCAISDNDGAGIYVGSGSGNLFRLNSIHANGGLGIDLAPEGVTPNDPNDSDSGPNDLVNFPEIDSVHADGAQTTIYGTYAADANTSYTLEFYLSDECDPSGYGEGQAWTSSLVVTTDANGEAEFEESINEALDGRYVTATATAFDFSTSEFSNCGPKTIRVVDDSQNPIANTFFSIYNVAYDPPTFTETFIDSIETDADGLIRLTMAGIGIGDSIKVYRRLAREASIKPRSADQSTIWWFEIDNAVFDEFNFDMSFDELDRSHTQEIVVNHTTIAISLLVCIEWNASMPYQTTLMQAYRDLSNYLYDVTDGQVRVDTVWIYDDRELWGGGPDILIHASNTQTGSAYTDGVRKGAGWHYYLPRKGYGSYDKDRVYSSMEDPLDMSTPNQPRIFGHELGHYAFDLDDEYNFGESDSLCSSISNYGFMFNMYASEPNVGIHSGGVPATEMSWNKQYTDPQCQNNQHWKNKGSGCWEFFEKRFEDTHDGIFAPIVTPAERNLYGFSYYRGPNEEGRALDYDVGELVAFPIAPQPRTSTNQLVLVTDGNGNALDNVEVDHITADGVTIPQGHTATNGQIIILDKRPGSSAKAGFWQWVQPVFRSGMAAQAASTSQWYSGQMSLDAVKNDNGIVEFPLTPIDGDFPVLSSAAPAGENLNVIFAGANPFPSPPILEIQYIDATVESLATVYQNTVYTATTTMPSGGRGLVTVNALDSSNAPFHFNCAYARTTLPDTGGLFEIPGQRGDITLELPVTAMPGADVVVLSTNYPAPREGLDPSAVRVSDIHNVMSSTSTRGIADGNVRVFFQGVDLPTPDAKSAADQIEMYYRSGIDAPWQTIGGQVYPDDGSMVAEFHGDGTYAIFRTSPDGLCSCPAQGDIGPRSSGPDGYINLVDVVTLVDIAFMNGPTPPTDPDCPRNRGDLAPNDGCGDSVIDVLDVTRLIDYIFLGGDPLCNPCGS